MAVQIVKDCFKIWTELLFQCSNMKRLFLLFCPILFLLSSCDSNGRTVDNSNLFLNGRATREHVDWQSTDDGVLLDISLFMQAAGGRYLPVNMNKGIVAQYGKRIGFSTIDSRYGMVQVQLCEMTPPCTEEDGRLWAPLSFCEALLDGDIVVYEEEDIISVSAPIPSQIGDIIPAAEKLSTVLELYDYTVLQGDICRSNAIDVCFAGYSPNANGNNAGFPYFAIQAPLPPDAEHAVLPAQILYTLREDEGLLLIGRTPPECDYFSYRSYLTNISVSADNPFSRRKIFTQLGDPINSYNFNEERFYPSGKTDAGKPFESFFMLVSTADRQLYEDVVNAATAAGINPENILLDVIDPSLVNLGNDDYADMMTFLHRFSIPQDDAVGEAYQSRPTLEILRITPNEARQADFLDAYAPRARGSASTEDHLMPAVIQLRQAIVDRYGVDYDIVELDTSVWLEKSGAEAIDAEEDVLGETRDALYLRSESFVFTQDTIVLVYGVNHARVSKSVYNNVSCYGAQYINGFGGITNHMYDGSATGISSMEGVSHVEDLYVWKFARRMLDPDTFVVPQDVGGNLQGIDNGASAFMVFRAYIDPDSPDLLGPDPEQIIFDRAIVLTPR